MKSPEQPSMSSGHADHHNDDQHVPVTKIYFRNALHNKVKMKKAHGICETLMVHVSGTSVTIFKLSIPTSLS